MSCKLVCRWLHACCACLQLRGCSGALMQVVDIFVSTLCVQALHDCTDDALLERIHSGKPLAVRPCRLLKRAEACHHCSSHFSKLGVWASCHRMCRPSLAYTASLKQASHCSEHSASSLPAKPQRHVSSPTRSHLEKSPGLRQQQGECACLAVTQPLVFGCRWRERAGPDACV